MDYYIIKDNRRQGPYPLEQLKEYGLTRDTMVWREGLDGWTEAANVDELAGLAAAATPPPFGNAETGRTAAQRPPMPKTWLAESIIVTLLCCLPLGIVGIVYSTQVENNYLMGNYKIAEYKSRQARNMVLIGAGLTAAVAILYFAFMAVMALISIA